MLPLVPLPLAAVMQHMAECHVTEQVLGVTGASDVEAFAAIRKAKDTF